ncbi:hypothetical protein ACFOLA_03755 [Salinicoccus hispanicus]|uniref:Uncharacterized protein n=1 Tax=Salinicoccus hispanicus TaxID=157225 RepID=A0A6N8U6I3_9STAP|nr:hypothetical protein [Salinicoccus hispanicus]MXQ51931.1 hypothetical protein [Salinicoccus hispanicus]
MKKVLIILLVIVFGVGIYVNFGMDRSIDNSESIANAPAESNEPATEDASEPERTEEVTEEATTEPAEPEEDAEETLTFNQESLDAAYAEAVAANEPLIIDVVVPSYYSDSFIDSLSEQFNSDNIEFNRVDLASATPELETVSVNANSDAVIMDALQISDYNAEALPERDTDRLTNAYMNLYEDGKVVYILGNPNVHQHDNLADVLEEDNDYLTSSDYYYIDNQDVSVEGDFYNYDADEMTPASETQIVQNIYEFMAE